MILEDFQFTHSHLEKCTGPTENCILSPCGGITLINLVFEGSDEDSQSSARHSLPCSPNDILYEPVRYLSSLRKYLSIDSKIFTRLGCEFQDDTKTIFTDKYNCELQQVDMKNDESVKSIKVWIDAKTDSGSSFDLFGAPSANNIMKLNSAWGTQFKEEKTSKDKFYVNDTESLDVDMMHIENNYNYINSVQLNAQILEIPFADEDLSMLVILPNNKDADIARLESAFKHELNFELMQARKTTVNLDLPKFKIQESLNMWDKKDSGDAYFKLDTLPPTTVGTFLTKTFLEVTELGAKATSINGCNLLTIPKVKEFLIKTSITNRFANTLVTNKVENLESVIQEASFTIILPENAFITEFVMVIEGKRYKSYIKEKEEAKAIYDEAVYTGKSAAHVAVSARDSNKFTVSVNVAPTSEATFLLTYEELLQRKYNQYELVLNVHPGQLVDILKVLVKISESRKLKYVKTPAIRSGNEVTENEGKNELAKIEISNSTATVKFDPDLGTQKNLGKKFGKGKFHGISGQFVLQYDVELDPNNGEVLINDGYFVHFYAPDDLPPLAKHVVFALDTSGSMGGRKIDQLRNAMLCILDQIRQNDLVSILEFNSKVIIHNIETQRSHAVIYGQEENYYEPFNKFESMKLPSPKPADEALINKAKRVVSRLNANDSTNIIGGLSAALYLVKLGQEQHSDHQPIVIFLTDGEPVSGICDTNEITKIITNLNKETNKAPIFSLSFGEDADKHFLRELSVKNFGFSRHIYEASDASLQLQQFYAHISSPLLSNTTFKYDSEVEEVTRIYFPLYFRGTDIVICGRYPGSTIPNQCNLMRPTGCVALRPVVVKSVTSLERLWAYLTVKQILEEREFAEDKTALTKKALELALRYSFVTAVTSLVVVKPESATAANIENAAGDNQDSPISTSGLSFGSSVFMKSSAAVGNFHNQPMLMASNPVPRTMARMSSSSFSFGSTATYNPISFIKKKISKRSGKSSANTYSVPEGQDMVQCLRIEKVMSEDDDLSPCDYLYGDTAETAKTEEPKVTIPVEMRVEHPFFVIIRVKCEPGGRILFAGKICKPVHV